MRPANLEALKTKLNCIVAAEKQTSSIKFANSVLFPHEIKSNNTIEGYIEDLTMIEQVLSGSFSAIDKNQEQRIRNLFHGYAYILENRPITKDNIKNLYKILSEGLLKPSDAHRMGEYYRREQVYILENGREDIDYDGPEYVERLTLAGDIQRIQKQYRGFEPEDVSPALDQYLEFVNAPNIMGDAGKSLSIETPGDEFIKTQIMHFYFIHIHPYYDVNSRTSRTIAMWHLLNRKQYPFIIFNRGINFAHRKYDTVRKDVIRYADLTYFLNYMMQAVLKELEKEHVMNIASQLVKGEFSQAEYQALLYFLTMKGTKTAIDICKFYKNFNSHIARTQIYETMIDPLIERGIFDIERYTKGSLFNNQPNMVLTLSKKITSEINPELTEDISI